MKIKITLILVSLLFTITTVFSNTDKLFFENDIFTLVKSSIENKTKTENVASSSITDQALAATDGSGNKKTATRTVTITDTTNPVLTVTNITVNSDAGVCQALVSNFGASATDDSNTQIITYTIEGGTAITEGTVFVVGTTQVEAKATDASDNFVSASFNVVVIDSESPTITLNGSETMYIDTNSSFLDPGATFADNCSATVTVLGAVNINLAGTYIINYKAVDASQNESATVSRTVIVNSVPPTAVDVYTTVTEGTQNNVINVITNDSFGLDGPGSISITTPPTSGTASVSGITILYTPVANVTSDTLIYTVEDANGDQVTASVNITINRLPSGVADNATVDEDSSNNIITILDNDDVDLDGLGSVNTGSTSPQSGTLSINTNNEVVYTPDVQFVGQDTFTYTITDGNGDISSDITVTIDVIVVAPQPIDDAYIVNQDTSDHLFDVLANDSFGADGPKGFTITTTTTNGALLLNDAGTLDPTDDVVIYTPTATYNGPDSFIYTLEDSNGDTTTASVTITVRPIVPVPVDDTATVDKNSSNNVISILANDDFGGDGAHPGHALTLSTVSDQGATISIEDNGTPNYFQDDVIFYTPFPDFVGIDIINYRITDADGEAAAAILTVTVVEGDNGNFTPTAVADIATVFEGSQDNVIFVLANDTSGIDGYVDNGLTMLNGTLTSISLKEGTVNIDNKGTASTLDDELHYTPKAGFIGVDILNYTITDATGDGSTATVTITVSILTDVPTAVNDIASVDQGMSVSVAVLDNDSFGTDGPATSGSLTVTGGSAESGTIAVVNNEVVYTPETSFVGIDSFVYTITDGSGDTSTATVTVNVNAVIDTPTAVDDIASVDQGMSVSVAVLDNDSFGTNGPATSGSLTVTGGSVESGTIDVVNNEVVYTPETSFVGIDSFVYTITDASGDTSTATVTVTITVRTTVPVPVDDTATVDKNSSNNVISILANDDFGGDGAHPGHALTLSTVSDQGATMSIDDNGTPNYFQDDVIFYTPFPDFVGIDIINYRITDADGEAATAILTVTVVEGDNGNFTPTAVADIATVFAGSQDNVIFVLANDTSGIDGYVDNGLTMLNGTLTSVSLKEGIVNIDNKGTASTLDDELHYTPKAGFIGVDILNYTITDATGDGSTATVTVTITASVTAVNDIASVDQGMSVSVAVLDNDSFGTDGPATSGSLTVTGGSVESGTIAVVNNEVIYTPATSFVGIDSFVYTITDASGDTSTATVTVNVNAVIDTPTAVDDIASVDQGMSVSVAVLDNDSFGANGPATSGSLTVTGGSVESGTIDVVNNEVVYTPATSFVGIDSFVYTITDDSGDTSTATVTVTITVRPTVPVPVDDTATVDKNSSNNVISILANDDFGGDGAHTGHALTLSTVSDQGATISIEDNGTPNYFQDDVIFYTPFPDFVGIDIINYRITDADGEAATAILTVTVVEGDNGNFTPTAVADTATVFAGSQDNVIFVLANDTSGIDGYVDNGLTMLNGTLTSVSLKEGTVNIDNKGTASTLDDELHYTPKAGFIGVDILNYTITDATGDGSTATVTVTITASVADDAPIAVDDAVTVDQDMSVSVAVLDNDSFGTDGPATSGSLTVTGGSTESGTIDVVNNEVVYTPATSFVGIDSFVYTITDDSGDTSIATVTVNVNAVNDTPTAVDDTASVDQGMSVSVAVLDNDSFGTDSPATSGSLTVTGGSVESGTIDVVNNEVVYTPETSFVGIDSFVYTITDTSGDTSTATVTVTITASVAADAPIAVDDAVTVDQNSSETIIDVTANDTYGTDQENATHPLVLINGKTETESDQGGSIRIGDSGTPNDLNDDVILYTPPTDYNGIDTFIYTITDGSGEASTATVTVTITSSKNAAVEIDQQENSTLENEFSTYPNPSNGYVKNTVFSSISTKATLLIFDITGKVLNSLPIQINKGANEFDLNLNVKPGILFIKITSPKVNFGTKKIIFK